MSLQVFDGRVVGLARQAGAPWGRSPFSTARSRFDLSIASRGGATRAFVVVGFELPVRIGDEVAVLIGARRWPALAVVNHSTVDGANYVREQWWLPVRAGDLLALSFAFIAAVATWSSAGATWFVPVAAGYLIGAGSLRTWWHRRLAEEVDRTINQVARSRTADSRAWQEEV